MISIVILLIALSALFSGLTIGMFSLSISGLERKIRMGETSAEKVLAIRKDGNYLLCTLVLGNVAVNAAIGQVLADLMPAGLVAGMIATGLIFLFGDMLPQAVVARHAFRVAEKTSWLVRIFMTIMWPIAKPLSLFLNWVLGKEHAEFYSKQELMEVINDQDGESIDKEEHKILVNAISFSEKTAYDVMTPITAMYRVWDDWKLDAKLLEQIREHHYSRIPVTHVTRDHVVGVLYAKDLIGLKGSPLVSEVCDTRPIIRVKEEQHLDSILREMITKKIHISFVYNEFNTLLGIVTMEDITEQILGEEIMDEGDTHADLQESVRTPPHGIGTMTTTEELSDPI